MPLFSNYSRKKVWYMLYRKILAGLNLIVLLSITDKNLLHFFQQLLHFEFSENWKVKNAHASCFLAESSLNQRTSLTESLAWGGGAVWQGSSAAPPTTPHTSSSVPAHQRLNMEVDLQSLFGIHVTWCAQLYSLAEAPQPPPIPPLWDSYTRALLVSKNRRHLFVTPCCTRSKHKKRRNKPYLQNCGVKTSRPDWTPCKQCWNFITLFGG